MKVNGTDVREFRAKQLKVDIQPPQNAQAYDWPDGYLGPVLRDTTQKFGSLKLEMAFFGETRNRIMRSISEFLELFSTGPVLITLNGHEGKYYGLLQKSRSEKTITAKCYKLVLELDGYQIDEEQTVKASQGASFRRRGSRKVYCTVLITPHKDAAQLILSGLNQEITVKNLTAGKTVVINGAEGLATEDGANKMPDINMLAFPALTEREITLTWTPKEADVEVKYTPAWL